MAADVEDILGIVEMQRRLETGPCYLVVGRAYYLEA